MNDQTTPENNTPVMTPADFAALGTGHVAYMRRVDPKEFATTFGTDNVQLPGELWALFAANGQPILPGQPLPPHQRDGAPIATARDRPGPDRPVAHGHRFPGPSMVLAAAEDQPVALLPPPRVDKADEIALFRDDWPVIDVGTINVGTWEAPTIPTEVITNCFG